MVNQRSLGNLLNRIPELTGLLSTVASSKRTGAI
jgi:hypothetical protein